MRLHHPLLLITSISACHHFIKSQRQRTQHEPNNNKRSLWAASLFIFISSPCCSGWQARVPRERRGGFAPQKDFHPSGVWSVTEMHPDRGQQEAGTSQAALAPLGARVCEASPSLIRAPTNPPIVPAIMRAPVDKETCLVPWDTFTVPGRQRSRQIWFHWIYLRFEATREVDFRRSSSINGALAVSTALARQHVFKPLSNPKQWTNTCSRDSAKNAAPSEAEAAECVVNKPISCHKITAHY